jgi:AhpC/TSA family protein
MLVGTMARDGSNRSGSSLQAAVWGMSARLETLRRGEGRMLEAGDKAPDFTVQDHTGQTRKLSDYRGKSVVLWFYPKADTPG